MGSNHCHIRCKKRNSKVKVWTRLAVNLGWEPFIQIRLQRFNDTKLSKAIWNRELGVSNPEEVRVKKSKQKEVFLREIAAVEKEELRKMAELDASLSDLTVKLGQNGTNIGARELESYLLHQTCRGSSSADIRFCITLYMFFEDINTFCILVFAKYHIFLCIIIIIFVDFSKSYLTACAGTLREKQRRLGRRRAYAARLEGALPAAQPADLSDLSIARRPLPFAKNIGCVFCRSSGKFATNF